ncbi:GNAT family N-acetyltransferase [Sulfitobacter aestuariivivens]|uniref:N-acetyltransferase n=1 Tax=Sulfitobacter aestuariivivens TaxID=2766981 RepID=A0A927HEF5_9RHOB|nr:GNAT family N-acetyltransferase [Sulfitobacter aestuariivivens]MBD3663836.1 N-acetyltransferase [Sulfitobacter aestuariivivens]
MSDPQITHRLEGSKGQYVLSQNGAEAVLTYSKLGEHQVIADHTEVPETLSGTGAGLKLVERLVSDARAQGFRIVPLCPFVNAMRRKHPEWADAFNV